MDGGSLRSVTLDDKYQLDKGRVFISGTQALVRLPIMQRQRDEANGLKTAGFISGYRGSPIGGMITRYGRLNHICKNII